MKQFIKNKLKNSAWGRKIYPYIHYVYLLYEKPRKRKRLQKHGFSIIQVIDEIATRNNIPYFASYGTLLGFIRDRRFLPHDDDLDFGIISGNISPVRFLDIFLKSEKKITFHRALEFQGKITEITLVYKKITIDFFFYEKDGDQTFVTSYYWDATHSYPSNKENSVRFIYQANVNQLMKRKINSVEVSIPVNYEELLVSQYGSGWKVPDPNWNNANHPGIVNQTGYGYAVDLKRVYELEEQRNHG